MPRYMRASAWLVVMNCFSAPAEATARCKDYMTKISTLLSVRRQPDDREDLAAALLFLAYSEIAYMTPELRAPFLDGSIKEAGEQMIDATIRRERERGRIVGI